MAKDPTSLPIVAAALLKGANSAGAVHEDVQKHFAKYCATNAGKLAEALPQWRAAALKEFGSGNQKITDTINDKRFDFFDEKNMKAVIKYSENLDKIHAGTEKMTLDEAQAKVRPMIEELAGGVESFNPQIKQMYKSLAGETISTIQAKDLIKPQTPEDKAAADKAAADKAAADKAAADKAAADKEAADKAAADKAAADKAAADKAAADKAAFAEEKLKAKELLTEAEKHVAKVYGYSGTIEGNHTGAEELLKGLELKKLQAEEAIKNLEEQGKDKLADGIDSILKNDLADGIAAVKGKQEELKDTHEDLKAKLQEIKDWKEQLDKLKDPSDEKSVAKLMSKINKAADLIEKGEEDAEETLKEAGKTTKHCIGRLHNNNEFNYYYVSHAGRFEGAMKDFSGEYGLLNQFFGGGPDGSKSAFESGLSTAYNGVARVGDWWHNVKMGARTQKERNMLNLTEQVVCGFGGLMALNAVDKLFFGGQMPGVVKWGLIIGMVGALLRRSGTTGAEMNSMAESRMNAYSQNSGRYTPKSIPNVKPAKDDPNAESPPRALKPEELVPKHPKTGLPLKEVIAEYNLDKTVTNQDANGTITLRPAFGLTAPDEKELLKLDPKVREAIKNEIDKNIQEKFVAKNIEDLHARMQGEGKALPKDFSGDVTINKINGVDLGEHAFTVKYVVGKGIIENMVNEQMAANSPMDATGTGE